MASSSFKNEHIFLKMITWPNLDFAQISKRIVRYFSKTIFLPKNLKFLIDFENGQLAQGAPVLLEAGGEMST